LQYRYFTSSINSVSSLESLGMDGKTSSTSGLYNSLQNTQPYGGGGIGDRKGECEQARMGKEGENKAEKRRGTMLL
jgi:hypothetical protein